MGGSAKSPCPSERQHVSGWGPELSLDWRRVSREVIGAGEREGGGGERERAREGERESVCGREGETECGGERDGKRVCVRDRVCV